MWPTYKPISWDKYYAHNFQDKHTSITSGLAAGITIVVFFTVFLLTFGCRLYSRRVANATVARQIAERRARSRRRPSVSQLYLPPPYELAVQMPKPLECTSNCGHFAAFEPPPSFSEISPHPPPSLSNICATVVESSGAHIASVSVTKESSSNQCSSNSDNKKGLFIINRNRIGSPHFSAGPSITQNDRRRNQSNSMALVKMNSSSSADNLINVDRKREAACALATAESGGSSSSLCSMPPPYSSQDSLTRASLNHSPEELDYSENNEIILTLRTSSIT